MVRQVRTHFRQRAVHWGRKRQRLPFRGSIELKPIKTGRRRHDDGDRKDRWYGDATQFRQEILRLILTDWPVRSRHIYKEWNDGEGGQSETVDPELVWFLVGSP